MMNVRVFASVFSTSNTPDVISDIVVKVCETEQSPSSMQEEFVSKREAVIVYSIPLFKDFYGKTM